jgi:nitroreductase
MMIANLKIVKIILPDVGLSFLKKIYFRIKAISNFFDILILRIAVISPFLSSFYYVLVSPAFRRENHAVIYGKLQYYKSLNIVQDNAYLLRRNVHRLEKGLIMQPRRDVFALDYIEETVDAYSKVFQERFDACSVDSELKWFNDVILEYFRVVSSHPIIDKAKEIFLSNKPLDSDGQWIPYKRDLNKPPSVSYDQFLELCYRRRSVRWYQQKPVPRELIDKAIEAATLSPSACNRQPFEFRVFDDPQLVKEVSSIPGGTRGFAYNFPMIIVIIGELRAYFSERDRHVIYIDGSLASMSLMFSLETLGLSSCPINWPDVDEFEIKMKSLLDLADDERPIMLISVGFPDDQGFVPYSQKKTLNQLRKYN